MTQALAYLRTSSATNVDGDSAPRQRAAIAAYAAANGLEITAEYYDAAVSGADPIDSRPGFRDMLARIMGNGVRVVVVEDASRFARDVLIQEAGIRILQDAGVKLVTAHGECLTDDTSPDRVMIRQIMGAIYQGEKARLVAKLKAARDRKAAETGKPACGQKGYAETRPDVVEAIRAVRAANPRATLAQITEALATQGFRTATGKPLIVQQVHRIVKAAGIAKGSN